MKKLFIFLGAICLIASNADARQYIVKSPSEKLEITISDDAGIQWSVKSGNTVVTLPSSIAISRIVKKGLQPDRVIASSTKKGKDFQSVILKLTGDMNLEFRAYDDAAAYRFVNLAKLPFEIKNEVSEYNFADDYKAFIPYVNDNRGGERYCYSFESYYDKQKLSEMYADSLAISPLAICLPDGKKAVIMEAGLRDYPGMFLKKNGEKGLTAEFAPYPLEEEIGGYARLNLMPTKRADYIAKMNDRGFLPWRVILVSDKDTDLLTSNIAQRLAPKSMIKDESWIKPGKVAWDWWNNTNITGVDFRSGMNTPTYKYYIDFAARNHLEYIIIDEGWSDPEDLYKMNEEIDLDQLITYAKNRNVGIILWSSWRNLSQQGKAKTEEIMKHYSEKGIKGFKVDFFDRDDQVAINSAWEVAAIAAKYHLLLDYHGLKPFGIQFAYPNILNFEGVKGLENSKWEPRVGDGPLHDQPMYDCEIPYLRMIPGPLDYTPGAMNNAVKSQFFGNNDHPMSQGTRVHQMAMYTIFHAPLQMLADSPTQYLKNRECTEFIADVPTVWDETIALGGEIGKYVALARRKGNSWYIAAMTNWEARDITLDLSKIPNLGKYAVIFEDGINADKEATDYSRKTMNLENLQMKIHLAPGGGWTGKVE